jgi:hypothetical protein
MKRASSGYEREPAPEVWPIWSLAERRPRLMSSDDDA